MAIENVLTGMQALGSGQPDTTMRDISQSREIREAEQFKQQKQRIDKLQQIKDSSKTIKEYLSNLRSNGFQEMAQQYETADISYRQNLLNYSITQQNQANKEMAIAGDLAAGVTNAAQWDAMKTMLKRIAPESDLPDQLGPWDPDAKEFIQTLGLSAKDILMYGLKEREVGAKEVTAAKPKGGSKEERLLQIMRDAQLKTENNIPLTRSEEIDVLNAEWELRQPKTITAPDGKIYQVAPPELPWKYSEAVGAQTTAPIPKAQIKETKDKTMELTQLTEKESVVSARKKIEVGFTRIEDIIKSLNEAKAANEDITGIIGTMKSKFGGIGRQANIPISPRSENLEKQLGYLQASLVEPLLNEKKVTDTERETIRKLIGDVEIASDEVSLRDSLQTLAKELVRVHKSLEAPK